MISVTLGLKTARRVAVLTAALVLAGVLAAPQTYTVQKGDTLFSLAKKFGLTVKELKALNNLTQNALSLGQVLVVSKSTDSTPATEDPAPINVVVPTGNVVHVVQKGDTLFSLAKRYGTSMESISKLNNLESATLEVGQKLDISSTQDLKPVADTPEDAEFSATSPLVSAVIKYLGTPYVYGANSNSALDCSAFVQQVYAELGVTTPRTSREQYAKYAPTTTLKQGDLVFFSFGGKQIDHVGIYMGRGVFAHANSYGSRVVIESLDSPYYKRVYKGARRVK